MSENVMENKTQATYRRYKKEKVREETILI